MVLEHKLCRLQQLTYQQWQAKIFSLWDQYEKGDQMTIEWQSSFYEPAPNSADHVIINNQIVKRPCSLWVRWNTKTAPLGATKSLKVTINESWVFHSLTILKHYCYHSRFRLIYLSFLVAPVPTPILTFKMAVVQLTLNTCLGSNLFVIFDRKQLI